MNRCICQNSITSDPCIICGKRKLVTEEWVSRRAAAEADHEVGCGSPINRCHVCDRVAVNADAALCLTCSGKADRGEIVYDPDEGWIGSLRGALKAQVACTVMLARKLAFDDRDISDMTAQARRALEADSTT